MSDGCVIFILRYRNMFGVVWGMTLLGSMANARTMFGFLKYGPKETMSQVCLNQNEATLLPATSVQGMIVYCINASSVL